MKYFIGNYNVNYQNYQNLMLLTSSDTKLQIPPRENWFYAEYTQLQLTFLALQP